MKVGVAGATGAVGQRFLELLCASPDQWDVIALGASSRSAGKAYRDAVHWVLPGDAPASVAGLTVGTCTPEDFSGCRIVFSGLDSSVAGPIEEELASAGIFVCSNAKNHRMDEDVPILLPLINADQIEMVRRQRELRGYSSGGAIVTNANCSSTGLATALAPLQEAFGVARVRVVTMQAISGAGYPGVSAFDISANVVPFISGEEDKLQTESLKILSAPDMRIAASCNRVPVLNGHTMCVDVELADPAATLQDVIDCLRNFRSKADLPSAPENVIVVLQGDRPQPRLDVNRGRGYTVSVGRVRECALGGFSFVVLSHNTIIGAAGGSILNAELAIQRGLVEDR